MEQKPLVIDGVTYPENLLVLKKQGIPNDKWELKIVYFLELTHGLMGFFPAVFSQDLSRIVFSTDKEVILKVWEKMSARPSKMCEVICHVSKEAPVGYQAKSEWGDQFSDVMHLMTNEEFEKLITEEEAFEWLPGLIGPSMSEREFLKTINNFKKQPEA